MRDNTSDENSGLDLDWERKNAPYSRAYGDYFCSSDNGREECRHVFIDGNKLTERLPNCNEFTIAELGFGTGLNFLETWDYWRSIRKPDQCLNFVSFERHPLSTNSMRRGLEQWPKLDKLAEILLEFWSSRTEGSKIWKIDHQTTLQVISGDANQMVNQWSATADAWYLDGFSPSKNQEMWSGELMQMVYDHTRSKGTFATYTSAGWVRRNLADAGFEVKRIPGHGKKRHMSIGKKPV